MQIWERRYRVMLNQLCNVDTVTVLEDRGFACAPGAACLLEKFESIRAEEAAALLATVDDATVDEKR